MNIKRKDEQTIYDESSIYLKGSTKTLSCSSFPTTAAAADAGEWRKVDPVSLDNILETLRGTNRRKNIGNKNLYLRILKLL